MPRGAPVCSCRHAFVIERQSGSRPPPLRQVCQTSFSQDAVLGGQKGGEFSGRVQTNRIGEVGMYDRHTSKTNIFSSSMNNIP